MATDGTAVVDGRAGIMFGVELYVPWDAPEVVVDLQSEGVVDLGRSRTLSAWLVGGWVLWSAGFYREEMCVVCVF